jgi:hypothetical protein
VISFIDVLIKCAIPFNVKLKIIDKSITNNNSENSYGG